MIDVGGKTPSRDASLSTTLRRVRLERRVRRLELVIGALDARARELRRLGRPVPAPLRQAMGSFSEELGAVRRELADP
jgi:hypothetical protein